MSEEVAENNQNPLQGEQFFAMIGAKREVDPETSETSSYQSSKAKEKPKPEEGMEDTDIKDLQAELKQIEESKEAKEKVIEENKNEK